MENFWDFSVWGTVNLITVVLLSLLAANVLKKWFPILKVSLIPTSVLGGLILLAAAGIYKLITGELLFDTAFFGGSGMVTLEMITYHTLALGFIAATLKSSDAVLNKKRSTEIFNTGVTTVATYLIQGIVGLGITIVASLIMKEFFAAAGLLLPFGYGQGTGQAMNYGTIYEVDYGFVGGKSFGLTIAALGFISASIGGVIHLNVLRRKNLITVDEGDNYGIEEQIEGENEIPMQGTIDKLTVQVALVLGSYLLAQVIMVGLGNLLPGMRSVIYGFNFLLGVLSATLVKVLLNFLRKKKLMRRQHVNNFLLTRCSNFFYDIMVVAGIAAIRLGILQQYWGVILILGIAGLVITYVYNRMIVRIFFKEYQEEQFLAMYGMLTGTASTGVILLREIDKDFKTPAADNLVYQNFPAIVFGFPLMLLATLAPVKPGLTWLILVGFFIVLNIILFRSKIFKKRR